MKIYAQEKEDGLEVGMKAGASIAMVCRVLPNPEHKADETVIAKILASAPSNPDQRDLYYLNSVLVSTGWNKNDDVFGNNEVWAARHTPVDKQFNFMHNENDIIGHITGSVVLDRDENDVTDQVEAPDEFDVVTSAVIYTSWSDEEQRDRVKKLTEEIDAGKWAVSMECLFNDFDYAVVTPNGEHKIVARDDKSAFLTKHLRSYGGQGTYEGYKLGRKLKNITFSGKGLVDNPANPRSIILDKDTDPFKAKSSTLITSINMENTMDLETLKAENQSLKDQLAEAIAADKTEAQKKVSDLEAVLAQKTVSLTDLEAKVADLEAQVEAKDKENKDFFEKFKKVDKERKDEKKKASLVEAGLTPEEALAKLEKFGDISDEAFAEIVAMITQTKKQIAELTDVKVAEVVAEDDTADAVADEEVVDELETTDASLSVTEDEDDSRQKVVAATSEWIKNSILKTTSNTK